MFKCGRTGKQSLPRQKPTRIVVLTRPKKYYRKDKYGNDILMAEGTEIIKEILVLETKEKL